MSLFDWNVFLGYLPFLCRVLHVAAHKIKHLLLPRISYPGQYILGPMWKSGGMLFGGDGGAVVSLSSLRRSDSPHHHHHFCRTGKCPFYVTFVFVFVWPDQAILITSFHLRCLIMTCGASEGDFDHSFPRKPSFSASSTWPFCKISLHP